jgi:hypothetical protein
LVIVARIGGSAGLSDSEISQSQPFVVTAESLSDTSTAAAQQQLEPI